MPEAVTTTTPSYAAATTAEPNGVRAGWQISSKALATWRAILRIRARGGPRGELSEADALALRAAVVELAHEVGFCRLTIEPHRVVGDKPWAWIHEQCQLERWQRSREISDALNAELLAQTQKVATG